jgi:hypothetical protein
MRHDWILEAIGMSCNKRGTIPPEYSSHADLAIRELARRLIMTMDDAKILRIDEQMI